jgi:hypothetical protein
VSWIGKSSNGSLRCIRSVRRPNQRFFQYPRPPLISSFLIKLLHRPWCSAHRPLHGILWEQRQSFKAVGYSSCLCMDWQRSRLLSRYLT